MHGDGSVKRQRSQQSQGSEGSSGQPERKKLKKGASRKDVKRLKRKQKAKARNEGKPRNPAIYRLPRSALSGERWKRDVYNCLNTHIRAIAVLPFEDSVPWPASEAIRAEADDMYDSVGEIQMSVKSAFVDNADAIAVATETTKILKEMIAARGRKPGKHAKAILQRSEQSLQRMYRSVATMGLTRWAPDLLTSGSRSMYNLLHRVIALDTFEDAARDGEFLRKGITREFLLENWAFVERCYDNYVHSYLTAIAIAESNKPGAQASRIEKNLIGSRRRALAQKRVAFMKHDMLFPSYIVEAMASPCAHSEDEEGDDPDKMDTTPPQPSH
ncbi:hypothetical protein HDZ31DRAFT_68448, partial [Schizophyllum fasciatum]